MYVDRAALEAALHSRYGNAMPSIDVSDALESERRWIGENIRSGRLAIQDVRRQLNDVTSAFGVSFSRFFWHTPKPIRQQWWEQVRVVDADPSNVARLEWVALGIMLGLDVRHVVLAMPLISAADYIPLYFLGKSPLQASGIFGDSGIDDEMIAAMLDSGL